MELLQIKQINEITVKELTDLADMNRGTFYLYYRIRVGASDADTI